jgi:hypothetical protein
LLTYPEEIINLYRGPSINVLIPLAKWYYRRRIKYAKLADDGCQTMPKALIAIDRGFLPDTLTNMAAIGNSCFLLVNF